MRLARPWSGRGEGRRTRRAGGRSERAHASCTASALLTPTARRVAVAEVLGSGIGAWQRQCSAVPEPEPAPEPAQCRCRRVARPRWSREATPCVVSRAQRPPWAWHMARRRRCEVFSERMAQAASLALAARLPWPGAQTRSTRPPASPPARSRQRISRPPPRSQWAPARAPVPARRRGRCRRRAALGAWGRCGVRVRDGRRCAGRAGGGSNQRAAASVTAMQVILVPAGLRPSVPACQAQSEWLSPADHSPRPLPATPDVAARLFSCPLPRSLRARPPSAAVALHTLVSVAPPSLATAAALCLCPDTLSRRPPLAASRVPCPPCCLHPRPRLRGPRCLPAPRQHPRARCSCPLPSAPARLPEPSLSR